jgi:hypothetical protein
MNTLLHDAEQIRANATCIHTAEAVTQALDQMAAQITADLSDLKTLQQQPRWQTAAQLAHTLRSCNL